MKTKIVVVDDEKEIADLVTLYLKSENYEIHTFYKPKEALTYIENNQIDLAIIDLMMPEIDGMELCSILRKKYTFPIIMLTAKDSDLDKINGLTIGADDYITKPFTPMEMVARVKAQLRRYHYYQEEIEQEIIEYEGLSLHIEKHLCYLNNKELLLTPKEFSILEVLCKNQGTVISTESLFKQVWKEKYLHNSNNTVMVHIRHLREKMNDTGEKPKYIKTVWGVGYKIGK